MAVDSTGISVAYITLLVVSFFCFQATDDNRHACLAILYLSNLCLHSQPFVCVKNPHPGGLSSRRPRPLPHHLTHRAEQPGSESPRALDAFLLPNRLQSWFPAGCLVGPGVRQHDQGHQRALAPFVTRSEERRVG